jgi:hypothetical protein
VSQKGLRNFMYKALLLAQFVAGRYLVYKEVIVTHAELEQVLQIFTINI